MVNLVVISAGIRLRFSNDYFCNAVTSLLKFPLKPASLAEAHFIFLLTALQNSAKLFFPSLIETIPQRRENCRLASALSIATEHVFPADDSCESSS